MSAAMCCVRLRAASMGRRRRGTSGPKLLEQVGRPPLLAKRCSLTHRLSTRKNAKTNGPASESVAPCLVGLADSACMPACSRLPASLTAVAPLLHEADLGLQGPECGCGAVEPWRCPLGDAGAVCIEPWLCRRCVSRLDAVSCRPPLPAVKGELVLTAGEPISLNLVVVVFDLCPR